MNTSKTKVKKRLDDDLETATEKRLACDDFAKDGKLWYRRRSCEIWVHKKRSGLDSPEWLLV